MTEVAERRKLYRGLKGKMGLIAIFGTLQESYLKIVFGKIYF